MEEKTYPVLQEIINRAYDDHNKPEYTKEQFWSRLGFSERIAVHCMNLYNQVTNGGFAQWHNNGYSTGAKDLSMALSELRQGDVANLVRQALARIAAYEEYLKENRWDVTDDDDDVDFDDLDGRFYAGLDDALLDAVEAYLTALRG
jgi:hypothetical protein